MPNDIESRETLKNTLNSIRRQRKLADYDRAKSLRRQYAAEFSVVRDALNSSVNGVIIAEFIENLRFAHETRAKQQHCLGHKPRRRACVNILISVQPP
jgi:hypothetical protein